MTRFRYTAKNADGEPLSGEMEAADAEEVARRLEADGARVEAVESIEEVLDEEEAGRTDPGGRVIQQMNVRDFRRLSGQLGELTEAGLPLVGGLAALAEELPNSRFRRGLRSIVGRLEAGGDLASVLTEHGAAPELQALLAAGVRSGRTGELLGHYAAQTRQISDIRMQALMALAYPLLILSFVVGVLLFILLWIVPMFKKIFEDFGTELPWITNSVVFLSDALLEYGVWLIGGTVLLAAVLWVVIGFVVDDIARRQFVCTIPVVGRLARYSALARFSHLLAILVENRVPLPEALTLAGEAAGDAEVRAASWMLAADAESGESLEHAGHRVRVLPATLVQALAWHNQPDVFADALRALAEMFETRARAQTGVIAAFWQPAVIVLLGVSLGYIVISLFAPLIKLLNDLS